MIKTFTRTLFFALVLSFSGIFARESSSLTSLFKDLKPIVKVYPNPISTEASVKIDDAVNLETDKVTFVIYNLVGKEVYKVSNIKTHDLKLTREPFLPGLYFYQLIDEGRIIATGRISVR